MKITAQQVKELRERTGAAMMDCKKALQEAEGDMEKAIVVLREKGLAAASKKSHREANEGSIFSYVHPGAKLGVLVEINCETDFVARTDDFQELGKNLAMQVAAAAPLVVRREELPGDAIEKEKEIYRKQAEGSGKPANVIDKIVEGKLEKFYHEVCLMEQPFIKNDKETVEDLVKGTIAKLGENIVVRRFARFQLGEELS
ncbi:MAG: translation elongation factor Ts [Candidatus Latescibacteria bacterium 4484_7]|nr:MAG: translation elongation factor Ts [Candidatus Latescibacteria bacterium 4484_7]RKZ05901.1 MAG: translation elongation factor Ts [bacterium]